MTDFGIDRLQALLDVHGSHRPDWPEAERAAAEALIRHDPQAAALWRHALALDDLLDGAPAPEPPPDLAASIARRAMARPHHNADPLLALLGRMPLWQRAAAAVVPLAFGFLLGFAQMLPAAGDAPDPAARELASISLYGLVEPETGRTP